MPERTERERWLRACQVVEDVLDGSPAPELAAESIVDALAAADLLSEEGEPVGIQVRFAIPGSGWTEWVGNEEEARRFVAGGQVAAYRKVYAGPIQEAPKP